MNEIFSEIDQQISGVILPAYVARILTTLRLADILGILSVIQFNDTFFEVFSPTEHESYHEFDFGNLPEKEEKKSD